MARIRARREIKLAAPGAEPSPFVLLHVSEVAERLGTNARRVAKWIAEGRLEARKFNGSNFVTEADLAAAFLAGRLDSDDEKPTTPRKKKTPASRAPKPGDQLARADELLREHAEQARQAMPEAPDDQTEPRAEIEPNDDREFFLPKPEKPDDQARVMEGDLRTGAVTEFVRMIPGGGANSPPIPLPTDWRERLRAGVKGEANLEVALRCFAREAAGASPEEIESEDPRTRWTAKRPRYIPHFRVEPE